MIKVVVALSFLCFAASAFADATLSMDINIGDVWCGYGCQSVRATATVAADFPDDGLNHSTEVTGSLKIVERTPPEIVGDEPFSFYLSSLGDTEYHMESATDIYGLTGCYYAAGYFISDRGAEVEGSSSDYCSYACKLQVYVSTDGVWTSGGESGWYPCGTVVSLTADAYSGFVFEGWTGAVPSSSSKVDVVVDDIYSPVEEVANFASWYNPPPPPGGGDSNNNGGGCPPSQAGCMPIILNLGLGTYELTSAAGGVRFDLDATGTALQTAWTVASTDQAFLVWDRNGNGRIDDGTELFGSATPLSSGGRAVNGFEALASYDLDRNGVIDARDPIFSHLRLWFDYNHNGGTDPAELVALDQVGVTSLNLDALWVGRRDNSGNVLRYKATLRQGNKVRQYYDVLLSR